MCTLSPNNKPLSSAKEIFTYKILIASLRANEHGVHVISCLNMEKLATENDCLCVCGGTGGGQRVFWPRITGCKQE